MANRDRYEMDILRALQKIGKHLESIDRKMNPMVAPDKTGEIDIHSIFKNGPIRFECNPRNAYCGIYDFYAFLRDELGIGLLENLMFSSSHIRVGRGIMDKIKSWYQDQEPDMTDLDFCTMWLHVGPKADLDISYGFYGVEIEDGFFIMEEE